MTPSNKRRASNQILRERIDRLKALHLQLHSLTNKAFEELLEQARLDTAEDTNAVLDETIKRYIERLRRQQMRIEQEFPELARGPVVSEAELAALIGPYQDADGGQLHPAAEP